MASRVFYYCVLVRPANLVTAVTDIFAGAAIASALRNDISSTPKLLLLICSTIGLYAGGVVFNDVFDAVLDKVERPRRPIPKGIISLKQATQLGMLLFLFAVLCAMIAGLYSGTIAVAIVVTALIYNKYAKKHLLLGPLVMGVCRSLNLVLGMSILSFNPVPDLWAICFVPILFISAVTLTSQAEVYGHNRPFIIVALCLDIMVTVILLYLGIQGYLLLEAVAAFVSLWFGMNLIAKLKAILINTPKNVMNAVKIGVLSLIPLNATYVAGFGEWNHGLGVLLLLPLAILLARRFSIT